MQTNSVQNSSKRNIVNGTLLGYLSIAVNIFSSLIITPLLITSIGKSDYGIYTLVLSVINLFVLDFGLGAASNSYLSRYRAQKNDEKIRRFVNVSFSLYIYIDIFVYGVLAILYPFLSNIYAGLTTSEIESFKSVFLIVGIFSLISLPSLLFNSILTAFEKFGFSKLTSLLVKLFYILGVIFLIKMKGTLFDLVMLHIFTEIVGILFKYIYCKKRFCFNFSFIQIEKNDLKEIGAFSLWALLNSVVSRLVFTIMPSLLGITSNSNEIAIFGIIITLEQYIYLIACVMNGFFIPTIERIKQDKDSTNKLMQLNIKVGKIQFFIVDLILIGFICCGKEFILFWMSGDTDFVQAYYGVVLISIYHIIYIPQLVLHSAMQTDKTFIKHLAICSTIKAIINISLAIPLTMLLGALGGAISVCLARIIDLILQNIFYKKDLKASFIGFTKDVIAPFLIPSVLTLGIGLCLHFFLPFSNLINFLIIGISVVIVFLVTTIKLNPIRQLRFLKGNKNAN